MTYAEFAKNQALGVVDKVIDMPPRHARAQTITIACLAERIEQFWRDPDQLSVVLGDIAEIDADGRDRYSWRLSAAPDVTWKGDLDPAKLISHDVSLEDGVWAYELFKNKKDDCIRVAMRPNASAVVRDEKAGVNHDRTTSRS